MKMISRKEREELSLLLPWHAIDALEPEEAERIEAALATDQLLADEYALVLQDREATREIAAQEPVPTSMQTRFDAALSARIAEENKPVVAPVQTRASSLFHRIFSGIFEMPRPSLLAAAAALIIAVQAGTIITLLQPGDNGNYQTASGKASNVEGMQLLIRFAPSLSLDQTTAWLEENQARIVEGPLPGGMFRLAFPKEAADDVSELAAKIGAETTIVILALPIG